MFIHRIAAALIITLLAGTALAQEYPSRPIRIVVPNPPGGSNDLLAREIGRGLTQRLGQPVVVENRPGAGGNIGAEIVAKAPPDGYTILMAANTFVINPSMVKQLPFDVQRDFAPVTLAAMIPFVLVVNPEVPAKNVRELIAYARANPGKLNYATPGLGTPHHLSAELFKTMANLDMVHVPFKGAAEMVPELLAGRVQVIFGAINSLLPHMKTGRLRALAVGEAKRAAVAPEVPTMSEAGLLGYQVEVWLGILAPGGTPRAIVNKLNSEIVAVLKTPEVRERVAAHGLETIGTTPEEFATVIRNDLPRWAKVVRDAGIKPE